MSSEFTKDVAREKLLTVATIMGAGAGTGSTGTGLTVRPDDKLAAVAGKVIRHGAPVPVIDETGTSVGVITGDRILDALYGAEG